MQNQTIIDETKHEWYAVLGYCLAVAAESIAILLSTVLIAANLIGSNSPLYPILSIGVIAFTAYTLFSLFVGTNSAKKYANGIEPFEFYKLRKFLVGFIIGLAFLLIPIAKFISHNCEGK